MTTAQFRTRAHWSQMKLMMLLVVVTKLLHFNLGQTLCGYDTVCPCNNTTMMCPPGFCCRSSDNTCGETTDYCGAKTCGSQCPSACGPFDDYALCSVGECCNILGFCGNTTRYCGLGTCASQCPYSTSECGFRNNNEPCAPGECCSVHGYCGVVADWCGFGNCSSQCPTETCGYKYGDTTCSNGDCCNIHGFCGNTTGHCAPGYCMSQCLRVSSITVPPPGDQVPAPGDQVPGPRPGKSGRQNLEEILLIIALTVVSSLLVVWIFIAKLLPSKVSRRGWVTVLGTDPAVEIIGTPKTFTYEQLKTATEAFGELLGEGGEGNVYRGRILGTDVAVKKIKSTSQEGYIEFRAEVDIISGLRHRSLIKLLGWCETTKNDVSDGKYFLVYELMPNGGLDKALLDPGTALLCWRTRFDIVTDIAAAVDYLHKGGKQKVIHRDIKSSNILLTAEQKAVLGDFGIARLINHGEEGQTSIPRGSRGYMAPELDNEIGIFTEKGDVYAFGVVVLEIACGRKVLDFSLSPENIYLVYLVWRSLYDLDHGVLSLLDDRLGEDYDKGLMELVLKVGLWCCHPDPAKRPHMHRVVAVLLGDGTLPAMPTSRPSFAPRLPYDITDELS